MPLRDEPPIGAPCWIDVFTSDTDKIRAFYGELFGWTSESAGPEYGGYINFAKNDVPVAGCMHNDGSHGQPDHWTIYLASKDAQATVDAAAAKGAHVGVPAMPVMDLGVMAVLTDSAGAGVGVWQPGLHKGFGILGEPGSPGWFELHTPDYAASLQFYNDVFSWDSHTMSDSPEFRYTTYGEGEGQLAGIMDAAAFLPAGTPASWSVYFMVEDTDAALNKIADLGGAMVQAAEDTPYGRLAQAADPCGSIFKLMSNVV